MGGDVHRLLRGDHRGLHRERLVRSRSAPPRPAATTGIISDAQYRFARGVDPGFVVPGLELATRLILELCGGEASEVRWPARPPAPPAAIDFDPAYVAAPVRPRRSPRTGSLDDPRRPRLQPSTGGLRHAADLAARRRGQGRPGRGGRPHRRLRRPAGRRPCRRSPRAGRRRADHRARRASATARRALAAAGYAEAVDLVVHRPRGRRAVRRRRREPGAGQPDRGRPRLHAPLDPARPDRGGRPQRPARLRRLRPVRDRPGVRRRPSRPTSAPPSPPCSRRMRRAAGTARRRDDLFAPEGATCMALLDELGAPVANLQVGQGAAPPWWRPGRSARLQLGPKAVMAEFGETAPDGAGRRWTSTGPIYAFEVWVEAIPEPKRKAVKTRPALTLSPLHAADPRLRLRGRRRRRPAGDLVRAVAGADRALIAGARVFDVYAGPGVPEGCEVRRRGGDHPAPRRDPDRRRDRGLVGEDHRRGGKGGRRDAAGVAPES